MITVNDLALIVDDLANGYSDTEGTDNGSNSSSDEVEDSAILFKIGWSLTKPRKSISQIFYLFTDALFPRTSNEV